MTSDAESQLPALSHTEVEAQLDDAQLEVANDLHRPTILVCGYTGCGKTSLIQGVCGPDVVGHDKIVHGRPGTMDYLNYASKYISFWDSQGFEPGDTEEEFLRKSRAFFRERQEAQSVDDHIHLVWYCIQGSGARVTACDLELIKGIFENVVVVITKKDITTDRQMDAIIDVLTREGIPRGRIMPVADNDLEARQDLVDLTHELLPEAYRDAFVAAQWVHLEHKMAKAQVIIHAAATTAAGIGVSSIPVADAALLSPVQMGMIATLASLYGCAEQASKGPLVTMAAESVGMATASSLLKMMPGLGNFIQAGVAAGITEAVGQMANRYLQELYKAKINDEKPPEFEFNLDEFQRLLKIGSSRKR